jgi:hypothetical protein
VAFPDTGRGIASYIPTPDLLGAGAVAITITITITELWDAGAAVTTILSTPSYQAAAQAAAGAIARMDPPAHALRILLDRVS